MCGKRRRSTMRAWMGSATGWMGNGLAALAAAAVMTTTAVAAHADEPRGAAAAAGDAGADEVSLKNGGIVRGTVVELEPGDHVTVQVLGASKPRVISWVQVADVDRGKYSNKAVRKE